MTTDPYALRLHFRIVGIVMAALVAINMYVPWRFRWTLRMLMQWGFYSSKIWRGHRFNTAMHYLFSAIWMYVSAVFAAALWTSVR